ncbi:MATE family efflux transporter [Lacticaseibacillus absianus]|uniref:MATE family efflux transporter n=1 Tax=Lacticaseibacillus absianus TaxID=2729623 RepID=UPI0015CB553E|nr:MATE family efflux transporter [Lacticaseibacillus absianus]
MRAQFQYWLTKYFSGESFDHHFVFALLGPVVVDQFFLVSFNFLNTAMIASSGEAAISAVNMVGSVNVFLIQIFVAVGLGGTVLIAQYFGAGERQLLGRVVNGAVYGAVLVGLGLALVFGALHNGLLSLLFGAASPAVMANARLYMLGVLVSYPFEALVEGTNGCLRGIGRTANSLQLSLAMNLMYLLFNLVTITWLHLGVVGMIIALNLSRWLAAVLAGWMLVSHRELFALRWRVMRRIDWRMLRRVIIVCIPFAAESFFFNGGKILIQMMIVGLGTRVIVTWAIGGSWTSLSEIIPSALGTALVPLVGQSMGRGNVADARKITKSFVGLGILAFALVDAVLVLSFSRGIQLFSPAPAIVPAIFACYLIFLVWHLLAWAFSFILPNALRAAGDGKFTTTVSLVCMWAFRVVGVYVFGLRLGYGLPGVCLIMSLEWALRGLIFIHRFRGDRWHRQHLI